MNITLDQILALVGKLDDSAGDDTPRQRFRRFLEENVRNEVGPVRDYIEACLRTPGPQYNRALQDLVNYIGRLLGFEVVYGRYQGVVGQLGFDGHWKSPTGFHLVIEVKTTEVYAINAATLVGYVDGLISAREIPDRRHALGLYVVGRPDPEVHQLENAIVAENRSDQLRVISADSLLTLAELMAEYGIGHADLLAMLRPSGPAINPLVELISGLVATARLGAETARPSFAIAAGQTVAAVIASESTPATTSLESKYRLIPAGATQERAAEDWIRELVIREQVWASASRRLICAGDRVCFYATQMGVVAHGVARTTPQFRLDPVASPDEPSWVFELERVAHYIEEPVVIDAALRATLDAFQGRDLNKPWAWFVQGTHEVTAHDFALLTRTPVA